MFKWPRSTRKHRMMSRDDVIGELTEMFQEVTKRVPNCNFEIHTTRELKSFISPDEGVLVMAGVRVPVVAYDLVPEGDIYVIGRKDFIDNLIRNREWPWLIKDAIRRIKLCLSS